MSRGVEVAGFDIVRSIVAARAWSVLAARFALTNSSRYRLRRFPHWGTASLLCRSRRGFFPHHFQIAEIRSTRKGHFGFLCRSGGIRTRGLLVPNQTRYQTALHLVAGADEGTRTPDLLITNRLLYQLSHIGTTSNGYYNKGFFVCPALFSPAVDIPRRV